MPKAEIYALGSEIVLGQTIDTNSAWISTKLNDLGIETVKHVAIADDIEIIKSVLNNSTSEIIIIGGGLGPTEDDLTREAIAEVTGRELYKDPKLLEEIENRFRKRGFILTKNNDKQAMIPETATAIHNPNGTAPAFSLKWQNKIIYALPGVPHEMKWLFENVVLPELIQSFSIKTKIEYETLKVLGMGESTVDDKIGDLMKIDNPIVGLLAHPGQVDVRITATGEDSERKILIDKTKQEIFERLNDTTIISEDLTPIQYLRNLLIKNNKEIIILDEASNGFITSEIGGNPNLNVTGISGKSNDIEKYKTPKSNSIVVSIKSEYLDKNVNNLAKGKTYIQISDGTKEITEYQQFGVRSKIDKQRLLMLVVHLLIKFCV
jgi:competence/damage-inducible protein CinA-like protein